MKMFPLRYDCIKFSGREFHAQDCIGKCCVLFHIFDMNRMVRSRISQFLRQPIFRLRIVSSDLRYDQDLSLRGASRKHGQFQQDECKNCTCRDQDHFKKIVICKPSQSLSESQSFHPLLPPVSDPVVLIILLPLLRCHVRAEHSLCQHRDEPDHDSRHDQNRNRQQIDDHYACCQDPQDAQRSRNVKNQQDKSVFQKSACCVIESYTLCKHPYRPYCDQYQKHIEDDRKSRRHFARLSKYLENPQIRHADGSGREQSDFIYYS